MLLLSCKRKSFSFTILSIISGCLKINISECKKFIKNGVRMKSRLIIHCGVCNITDEQANQYTKKPKVIMLQVQIYFQLMWKYQQEIILS